jgi:hypothetical protein
MMNIFTLFQKVRIGNSLIMYLILIIQVLVGKCMINQNIHTCITHCHMEKHIVTIGIVNMNT